MKSGLIRIASFLLVLVSTAPAMGSEELRLDQGDACASRMMFWRPRVAASAPAPARAFLSHLLDGTDAAALRKYSRITDRSEAFRMVSTPDILVNAYLDFLEVGGEALFRNGDVHIHALENRTMTLIEWLKARASPDQVSIELASEGAFIRMKKLKGGDQRFNLLKKTWWGKITELDLSPAPARDRFPIHLGKHNEKKSSGSEDVFSLGHGDNGIVERIIPKSNPEGSYVRKTYFGVMGMLNMIFEKRGLRLLQNAAKAYPIPGVSVVRIDRTFLNRVYLADTRGVSLQELINRRTLTEWEMKYLQSRRDLFEDSVDRYLQARFPLKKPKDMNLELPDEEYPDEVSEDIRSLRELFRKITIRDIERLAKRYDLEIGKTYPGRWLGEIVFPITLNPFSPGFILPLRINLSPSQLIVDPVTLHITVIDPQ